MKQRVLIVEDDIKTVALIRLYLERSGYEVFEANDGQSGLKTFERVKPDLVVLDLMLPRLSGMEICKAIRETSNTPVIILTARTTETDKLAGLYQGADDYIAKPFSPRELVARVHTILRRAARHDDKRSEIVFGELCVNLQRHEVSLNGRRANLTPKEFRLLETFVRSPGRAFTRQELAERAFGWDYEALDRTIDAHVANLRRKLQSNNLQSPLITTVFGVGYKFVANRNDS
jgi:DNA-binding response OmpR family regulator